VRGDIGINRIAFSEVTLNGVFELGAASAQIDT
jgi:hypothetical protein